MNYRRQYIDKPADHGKTKYIFERFSKFDNDIEEDKMV